MKNTKILIMLSWLLLSIPHDALALSFNIQGVENSTALSLNFENVDKDLGIYYHGLEGHRNSYRHGDIVDLYDIHHRPRPPHHPPNCPTPTPVPPAVWLLGTGLLDIFSIRRKFGK